MHKDQAYFRSFSQKKLSEDVWYFIELYHLKAESPKNLVIYILSNSVGVIHKFKSSQRVFLQQLS